MSHYVTPFIVLNLGCEMVFVVAQRLQAQKITAERTNLVLDEIISVLISKQLIAELMKPQAAYNHEAVRDIIEDVAQSSAMRLDATSMGKLWDLITMVHKWQLTISEEVIAITLRHLYEIETYLTNPETQLQLHKVQNLVDNFNKLLNRREKEELRDDLLYWLKDCNIRVSLLLRMGLQGMDGRFITDNLDPIAEDMLKNLGENIYAVTDNGKILENKNANNPSSPSEDYSYQPRGVNELQLFVDQILGDRKLSDASTDSHSGRFLRLSIDEQNGINNNNEIETNSEVDNNVIDVRTDQISDFMGDLDLDNTDEGKSLRDDLLEMIGGEDLQPDEV